MEETATLALPEANNIFQDLRKNYEHVIPCLFNFVKTEQ